MPPAHERERPGPDDAPRPGGGTYPVRAAVSAQHPEPPPERRPSAPPRQFVAHAPRHGSPRAFLTLVLIGFALVTLVLLMLSLAGYVPESDDPAAPAAEPAPAASPDS